MKVCDKIGRYKYPYPRLTFFKDLFKLGANNLNLYLRAIAD